MFQKLLKEEVNFKWYNLMVVNKFEPKLFKTLTGPTIIHVEDWHDVSQFIQVDLMPQTKSVTLRSTVPSPLPTLIIEPTNNTLMPLRIKNIDVLTKYCQHQQHSEKQLLKLLLFNRYDAKQRVAIPYTMQQCLTNIQQISLLFQQNPIYRNEFTNFSIKFQKCQSKHNTLYRYLVKESIFDYHTHIGTPNKSILKNLNKSKHINTHPPILKQLLTNYTKFKQITLKQHKHTIKSTINQLKTLYQVNKCLNTILQQVETSYLDYQKQQHSIRTLQKYIKSLTNIISPRPQHISTIQRYLSTINTITSYNSLSQHFTNQKTTQITKIQKYIKCYMLKLYKMRQLQLQFLRQQHLPIKQQKHLLQQLINKNNQAKPYQKLAFIQIEVLSILMMNSKMASTLQQFIKCLIKDMKQEERVIGIGVADGTIQIKTNKRLTSYGIGNNQPITSNTTLNKHYRLNDNLVLDVEETPHGNIMLLDNKTIIDHNMKIIYKESNNNLMAYQLACLSSNTMTITLIKKLNFCQTNLNLALKKQIVKQASRYKNKHSLFKIGYCQEIAPYLIERVMPKPLHAKDNTLEQTNLLLDLPADNDLTFSL